MIFFAMLLSVIGFAAVEIGENYVMYDFCEYDGNSSLPYGKGSNGNCYYPRGEDTEYIFPEVYTWSAGSLSEASDGVRLYASSKGAYVSTTIDKVPAMYQQSLQRDFNYLILHIKANTVGKNTITFSSLGNNYRKNFSVNYTGDWQTIVLDLSGKDGWTKKNSDGSYSAVSAAPWENGYFGFDGFGIVYNEFGADIKSEVLIKYYAFTDDASLVLQTGKMVNQSAYIKGNSDGLFRPNDSLTRLQAAIIICRLLGYSDDEVTAPADYEGRFSDVSSENYGYKFIAFLDSLGVLSRYENAFSSDTPITVSELCAMLINAEVCGNGRLESVSTALTDNSKIITRAEACALINQLTGRQTDFDFDNNVFPDMAKTHSLYNDISAASLTMEIKQLSDGTSMVISAYNEPDYALTESIIADIDKEAKELYNSIHNSKTEIVATEKCYYVSPNGNDTNSGTSPNSPWKTLDKVNSVGFSAGSTVFFERGGLWRGSLTIRPSVTYTAYGNGDKPTIYGSPYDGADESLWTLVEGTTNIWKFKYDMPDCGSVVFNHGEYHSYKETPSYNGSTYLHRNSTLVFDYKTDISENLGIFCDNKRNLSAECPLYLRCDEGNPGKLFDSIEFMPRGNIMNVVANQNVVIDNFCLKYGGSHGIGAGTVKNFTVQNCEFHWIGGSIQSYNSGGGTMPVRYGNAVESYGTPDGFYVENNYIYQVYDAGITHQLSGGTQANTAQKNIRYANNLIEYCSYSIEYFLGDGDDGTSERYMENVVIENNIMRYAGFGFGNQRKDRLCMSHIKSGSSRNAVSENFVIRNNIFDRSREMLIYIGAAEEEDLPVLSGNTYIQYETLPETPYSTLGKYGAHTARLRFFTKDMARIMKDKNIESDASVYFAKKDWLYDLTEY